MGKTLFLEARGMLFLNTDQGDHSNVQSYFDLLQLWHSGWLCRRYSYHFGTVCRVLGSQGWSRVSTLGFCMDHCMLGVWRASGIFHIKLCNCRKSHIVGVWKCILHSALYIQNQIIFGEIRCLESKFSSCRRKALHGILRISSIWTFTIFIGEEGRKREGSRYPLCNAEAVNVVLRNEDSEAFLLNFSFFAKSFAFLEVSRIARKSGKSIFFGIDII